jgi:hypothetical protein
MPETSTWNPRSLESSTTAVAPNLQSNTLSKRAGCREATYLSSPLAERTPSERDLRARTIKGRSPAAHQKLEGSLEVSVDFHGEDCREILEAMKSEGAKNLRTK